VAGIAELLLRELPAFPAVRLTAVLEPEVDRVAAVFVPVLAGVFEAVLEVFDAVFVAVLPAVLRAGGVAAKHAVKTKKQRSQCKDFILQ